MGWTCDKCGAYVSCNQPHYCTQIIYPPIPVKVYSPLQGWVCPRCSKVHAPWVPICDCMPQSSPPRLDEGKE